MIYNSILNFYIGRRKIKILYKVIVVLFLSSDHWGIKNEWRIFREKICYGRFFPRKKSGRERKVIWDEFSSDVFPVMFSWGIFFQKPLFLEETQKSRNRFESWTKILGIFPVVQRLILLESFWSNVAKLCWRKEKNLCVSSCFISYTLDMPKLQMHSSCIKLILCLLKMLYVTGSRSRVKFQAMLIHI